MQIFSDFGWIEVDSKHLEEDIVVDYEGNIFERPKYLSRSKKKLYGHTPLTLEEFREIIKHIKDFDVVIIGTGYQGAMPVEEELLKFLRDINKKFVIVDTPKAIDEFLSRKNKEKVIAIFHITC